MSNIASLDRHVFIYRHGRCRIPQKYCYLGSNNSQIGKIIVQSMASPRRVTDGVPVWDMTDHVELDANNTCAETALPALASHPSPPPPPVVDTPPVYLPFITVSFGGHAKCEGALGTRKHTSLKPTSSQLPTCAGCTHHTL